MCLTIFSFPQSDPTCANLVVRRDNLSQSAYLFADFSDSLPEGIPGEDSIDQGKVVKYGGVTYEVVGSLHCLVIGHSDCSD